MHLRCLPIAKDLYIAGLGGSVPGYQDGQQCWNSKYQRMAQGCATRATCIFLMGGAVEGGAPLNEICLSNGFKDYKNCALELKSRCTEKVEAIIQCYSTGACDIAINH